MVTETRVPQNREPCPGCHKTFRAHGLGLAFHLAWSKVCAMAHDRRSAGADAPPEHISPKELRRELRLAGVRNTHRKGTAQQIEHMAAIRPRRYDPQADAPSAYRSLL